MTSIKKVLFLFSLILNLVVNAQLAPGANCGQAGCSTTGNYQNLTGVGSMGTYSCLFSTPNPNWLAIGIGATGSVHL